MTIVEAAAILRPGSFWVCHGEAYEGLKQAEPENTNITTPSKAEIESTIASRAYAQARANAYPNLADQLDAIWKGEADMDRMREQVLAVKARFPKP